MMYRDDDMPQGIGVNQLDLIHNEFVKRNKIHTMCILASELDSSPEFVNYINTHSNINLVLHGWKHLEYAKMSDEEISNHLEMSVISFIKHFHIIPKEWHPPWNGWVKDFVTEHGDGFYGIPKLQMIADKYNIKVVSNGRHLNVLLHGEIHDVVYFHHWHKPDVDTLPSILDLKESYEKHI